MKVTAELPTPSAERLLNAYKTKDSDLVKHLVPLVLLDLRREGIKREGILSMNETDGHAARPLEPGKKPSGRRSHTPNILLFDDNKNFAETWAKLLRERNFAVSTECNPREVHNRIGKDFFDVILLDLIVENDDDYSGLDVLMDIMTYSKRSQVIIVSGTGAIEQIVTAIKHGASSFISKSSLKKPEDVEILTDHISVALRAPEIKLDPEILRENLIDSLWSNIRYGDQAKKGRHLEQLVKLLFESLPAFYEVETNLKTSSQEIDLLITHHNTHPLWQDFGGVFLGECKNWSRQGHRPQRKDYATFHDKLRARGPLGRLGFFISINGFSSGFMDAVRDSKTEGIVVVPLDGTDIAELVAKNDGIAREEYLRNRVVKATMR